MKRLTLILAFAAIACASHAQVSKPVQDSTNKYYVALRDFVSTLKQHDTTGMTALMEKHIYWRNLGLSQCHNASQRSDFFDGELKAYRQFCIAQGKNPD